MAINTSIYIKSDLLGRVFETASYLGISSNKIITLLLYKVMNNKCSMYKLFNPVCYQRGDKNTKWNCFHISLKDNVYEAAIDLRKMFKMSVSFIIAIAIAEYLEEIIQDFYKNTANTDNYHHTYIFISNNYEGIFSFTIFWGIPPKKILKTLLN